MNGGGGAIFINNSIDAKNDIFFNNLTFESCEATYGGAVVIYSISDLSDVTIFQSNFSSNKIIGKGLVKKSGFCGGSGAFISAKNLLVNKSIFVRNKGSVGGLKIYNAFNEKEVSKKALLDMSQKSIVVSNCDFQSNEDSKSSIYYVNGKDGSMIDIINCNFNSNLNDKNSNIDGIDLDLYSPKVLIKSCSFRKVATNIKIKSLIIISTLAVFIIIITFFIKKVSRTDNCTICNLEKSDQI